jgi:hypothetical protein
MQGGRTTPLGLGVAVPPPWPREWSGHPQKATKKKKKGFGLWGWPDHPLRPWGWPNHPHGQGGGPATHKRPPKKKKKKVLAYGGGWTTPIPTGLGVAEPPPWPRGWSGHPQKATQKKKKSFGLWGCPREWFGHLCILSFFFFFFVIFLKKF